MRRIAKVVCGCVLALGLTAGVEQDDRRSSRQGGEVAAQHGRDEFALEAIARAIENNRSAPPTEYEKRQAADDVQAQRDMALWALVMCVLAGAQLVIGGLGIWYIRKTLVATEGAVREAGDATIAANKSVAETARIGEAQVRAYLSVIGAEYILKEGDFATSKFVLKLNNSGSTPATSVSIFCGCNVLTIGSSRSFRCPETVPFVRPLNAVPASSTLEEAVVAFGILPCLREFDEAWGACDNHTLIKNYPVIAIWGSIFYEDVFRTSFRSDFAFSFTPQEGRNKVQLSPLESPAEVFVSGVDRAAHIEQT